MHSNCFVTSVCALIFVMTASCVSTKGYYKELTRKKHSLEYLHDSQLKQTSKIYDIALKKVEVVDGLPPVSKLVKTKKHFLPFLFINFWDVEFSFEIGSSILTEEIPKFFENEIIEEAQRNSVFNLVEGENSSGSFSLQISIESMQAGGSYKIDGEFLYGVFFWVSSEEHEAGPNRAHSRVSYKLFKDDQLLAQNMVSSTRSISLIQPIPNYFIRYKTVYTASIVESLSLTLKDNIEVIVGEVNEFLDNQ